METLQSFLMNLGWGQSISHGIAWVMIWIGVAAVIALVLYKVLAELLTSMDLSKKKNKQILARLNAAFSVAWLLYFVILLWMHKTGNSVDAIVPEIGTPKFSIPWWKLLFSSIVVLSVMPLWIKTLRSSFFIDLRNIIQGQDPKSTNPPKPHWLSLASVVLLVLGLLSIFWLGKASIYVLPLSLAVSYWLGGIIMVPIKEYYLPVWTEQPMSLMGDLVSKKGKDRYHIFKSGFHWFWIPTWFPWFKIFMLRHESVERVGITAQVPTAQADAGESEDDAVDANIIGATIATTFRLTLMIGHVPSVFLDMSNEEQASILLVAIRITEGWLAKNYRVKNIQEIISWDPMKPESPEDTAVLEDLKNLLLQRIGCKFVGIQFMDHNPAAELEDASNKLAAVRAEKQREGILGEAAGLHLNQEIKQVLSLIAVDPEHPTAEEKSSAMRYIIERDEASRSAHIMPRGSGGAGVMVNHPGQ